MLRSDVQPEEMKTCTPILVALMLAAGCTGSRDSADYDITPGLGISNLVVVGMTTPQIRRSVPGVVLERYETGGFSGSIPWLGASWGGEDTTGQVYRLDFLIDPAVYADSSPTWQLERFRGTLAGVSLGEPKTLRRETLVQMFGEPENAFDIRTAVSSEIRETGPVASHKG